MKQQIEKKLEYYKQQTDKFTDRHLKTCKRTDRDALMRCKERVKVYQEILKLIQ